MIMDMNMNNELNIPYISRSFIYTNIETIKYRPLGTFVSSILHKSERMEKISQLKLACLVVLLLIASSGLPRGSTEEVVVACKDDKVCDEMCGSIPGSGKCIDGKCECLSGKFAGQKFSPDHLSKT